MRPGPTTVVLAAASMLATGAAAQSTSEQAEIADLRNRIAALEQANATAENRPRLAFSLGESTTISIYGFVRAEAFYDFDFAQGDLSLSLIHI